MYHIVGLALMELPSSYTSTKRSKVWSVDFNGRTSTEGLQWNGLQLEGFQKCVCILRLEI